MPIQVSGSVNDDSASELRNLLNTALDVSAECHFFDGILPDSPADPDDGTELASCPMDATPFVYSGANVFEANTITPATAIANGTLSYWRMKSGGGTVVVQGDCGTDPLNDIVFDNDAVTIGDTITVTSFTVTLVIGGE